MTARHDWPEFSKSFFRGILNAELLRGLLKIVGFRNLNGPLLLQNPLENVGGFAPHLLQWALL